LRAWTAPPHWLRSACDPESAPGPSARGRRTGRVARSPHRARTARLTVRRDRATREDGIDRATARGAEGSTRWTGERPAGLRLQLPGGAALPAVRRAAVRAAGFEYDPARAAVLPGLPPREA